MTPQQFIDYLTHTYNLKPPQAVLKACELLGVTKSLFYKWLNGTKNPHRGKLNHMELIVKNGTLGKYTQELEQYLISKLKQTSIMNTTKSIKDEVIGKLIQYNADHPGPFADSPQIKRVDWYAVNNERNIDNIKAISQASHIEGLEGYADSVIVTVHGALKRSDPQEDTQLNKAYDELRELMKPLRTEEHKGIPATPWKTKEFIVYLKRANRR